MGNTEVFHVLETSYQLLEVDAGLIFFEVALLHDEIIELSML